MTTEQKNSPLLLFDIGNIFVHADHRITHAHLHHEHSVPLERAQQFYKIPEYRYFAEGKIGGTEFYEAMVEMLGADHLSEEHIRYAHDIHMARLIKSSMEVLDTVSQNYDVAFITTTNTWQTQRETQLFDFSAYSNVIVRSHDEGLTKADPEIFERTLERLGRLDVLFVDDSLSNIQTAQSMHIDSLHVVMNRPNLGPALRSRGIIFE